MKNKALSGVIRYSQKYQEYLTEELDKLEDRRLNLTDPERVSKKLNKIDIQIKSIREEMEACEETTDKAYRTCMQLNLFGEQEENKTVLSGSEGLPKTGETENTIFFVIGVILVSSAAVWIGISKFKILKDNE